MCGIAGAVNWGNAALLARMTDVQRHRGPDDGGIWETRLPDGTWVGLGSRRLSILDLSAAGHMPMSTPDGRLTIVYNGEVYNYPELRQQLEGQGYQFHSHSDTEAVLYLYQEHGPECVHHLNGMFAFAIWDQDREQLFLARDHLGIKPCYYAQRGRQLAFASEIKGLLELPDLSRELDYQAVNQYLTFLWVPDPLTMFEGIHKLPPGHFGIFRRGQLQLTKYWDLELPVRDAPYGRTEADLIDELYSRFAQVIKRQMLSDVPVGAFLSAGLDSSSIVAVMSSISREPVRTYTISVADRYRRGSNFCDDPAVARRTAARYGCIHTEIE
ncbi:MAG: asparagine synthase (glutamine-hydrolyzing), partial [Planctomycetaceae bacterium]|nr:asparagine synthase (glutamine-hydrolyzing) [Planctomycetaceae bacterium]